MRALPSLIFACIVFAVNAAENTGAIKIQPDVRVLLVKEGNAQVLNCSFATNIKKARLDWEYPKDAVVVANERASLVSETTTKYFASLTISKITKNHAGDYTCSFSGSGTESKSNIALRLISENKTSASFTFGDKLATLSCQIESQTTIKNVKWLKNDTLVSDLKESKRFKFQDNALIITDPRREDADLYIARFSFDDMIDYDCHVQYTASPLVLDFDKSKNLIQEDRLELQCKVIGYPRADVTWFKNKQVLNITKDNDQIKQSPLNGYINARLIIKSVAFKDAGEYTCEAYSEQFNSSSAKTITVRVKDKLAALWPFLGIVGEVIILCTIIFIYEKRRNKRAEQEGDTVQDADGPNTDKKEGLRHRNTPSNNPTA